MELKPGWVGEENGMKFLPHVYLTDITRFYRDVINKKDFIVYYKRNFYNHRGFHKNHALFGQLLGKMKVMLVVRR